MSDIVERLRNIDAAGRRDDGTQIPLGQCLTEAAETILALRKEVERLREHVSEQVTHVETRIQDGIELGATVWRIALEDVARENRAALATEAE